jgi:hypothetical protein
VGSQTLDLNYFTDHGASVDSGLHVWSLRDTDGDGLSDALENSLGTAIDNADTDSDGVGDKDDYYPLDPNRSAPDFASYRYGVGREPYNRQAA